MREPLDVHVAEYEDWDPLTIEFDSAADAVDKAAADCGGKLLLYHGWNDQLVAPLNSVNYYNRIASTVGSTAANSVKLFMMPGTNHCAGGDGPNTFDRMRVIEQWVEQKQTPSRIEASHSTAGKVDRTRPLCAYPEVARYTGTGSPDEAANLRVPHALRQRRLRR